MKKDDQESQKNFSTLIAYFTNQQTFKKTEESESVLPVNYITAAVFH